MLQDTRYTLTLRILPKGDEVEMALPAMSTGKAIKDSLLNHADLGLPRFDGQGNPQGYKLTSKFTGTEIPDDRTLYECNIQNGDTLLMLPTLVAG